MQTHPAPEPPSLDEANRSLSARLGYAAGLSAGAGVIHLMVTREHFEHWFGYGLFFLIVGSVQIAYALLLGWRPSPQVFQLGVVGHLLILLLYISTRTIGIPFFGPDAWEVEPVSITDLVSKIGEGILMVLLVKLWKEGAFEP